MFRTNSLFAGLVLSVVAGSNFANAAQPNPSCTDRESAVSHLAQKYREKPVALGLASNGGIIEVLTNDAGSIWSIIVTMPDGTACMIATGEHWEPVQALKAGSPI